MLRRDRPQMMRRCTFCTADARVAWLDQLVMCVGLFALRQIQICLKIFLRNP